MKIVKYKYLGNSKYEVYLDDKKYILYEDIIIKSNLLSKKEISDSEFNSLISDSSFYEAYYKCIKYISIRYRSALEIEKYLSKDYDNKIIDNVVLKLKNDGYINDYVYARAYVVDQINLKNTGPIKIKKDLLGLGICSDAIDKSLILFNDDLICEKIKRIIDKEVKLNKNKSSYVLKNNINNKLINLGYKSSDFLDYLSSINIDDDLIKKREYDKLYKKLSLKYSGNELDNRIKQKMYSKGFKI